MRVTDGMLFRSDNRHASTISMPAVRNSTLFFPSLLVVPKEEKKVWFRGKFQMFGIAIPENGRGYQLFCAIKKNQYLYHRPLLSYSPPTCWISSAPFASFWKKHAL